MPKTKHISAVITDQNVTDILGHITSIRGILTFLVNRDAGDSSVLLGDKSAGFDEKCEAYMASNPEFLPGYIKMADVLADRAARDQLSRLLPEINQLSSQAGDCFDLLGNQIYGADLAYYNNSGDAAKKGLTAAQDVHDDLATRYPGHAPKGPTPDVKQTSSK